MTLYESLKWLTLYEVYLFKLCYKYAHIKLIPHPWRRLKTKSSQRVIPLVNESLWASKRILEHNDNSLFALPRYTSLNCTSKEATCTKEITNSSKYQLGKLLEFKI
jgi:hypothetical protein